jgi:hypothetical protein
LEGRGRDRGIVQDPALVQRDPRQVQKEPPLVLDRLIGREHDQPDRRPLRDAAIEPVRQIAMGGHLVIGNHGHSPSPHPAPRILIARPATGARRHQ